MNPAEIERLYRIRASLPPAQRAEIERLHAEMRGGGGPMSPNPVRSWGPEGVDPVEAAAAPITPSPAAGGRAQMSAGTSRPGRIPVALSPGYDPVAQALGGQLYTPRENIDSMQVGGMDRLEAARRRGYDADLSADNPVDENAVSLVAQRLIAGGEDPASARRRAREYVLLEKQNVRDSMPKPRASSPADLSDGLEGAPQAPLAMDSGLGDTDEAGRDWSNWSPGMPLPPAGGRSMGPGDDSQRGPGYAKVPGPRLPNGMPAEQGDVIYDPKEAERYRTRTWNNEQARYNESPEDRDYYKRGRLPVYNPDGSVSYSTGYMPGALESAPGQMNIPGAPGRAGNRPDLEAAGWGKATVSGPTGEQEVYRPGKGAQYRYQEQSDDRARVRLAKQAGISGNAAMGMPLADLRRSAKAAGVDDYNARNSAWKAQAMLAGGQPTGGRGGSKAITNALMMLPEEQRNASLRYMLPGGQLAAGVDAQQLQAAAALAQRAVTGALAGTAQGPMAQAQAELAGIQAQAERDKLRSGDEDVLGEKYARGGWLGYDEFTVAEQQQMYDDLIAQGYKPAEAQRAVDRQANKRRASKPMNWNTPGA